MTVPSHPQGNSDRVAVATVYFEDDKAFVKHKVWSKARHIDWHTAFDTGSYETEHGEPREFNSLGRVKETLEMFKQQAKATVAFLVLPGEGK